MAKSEELEGKCPFQEACQYASKFGCTLTAALEDQCYTPFLSQLEAYCFICSQPEAVYTLKIKQKWCAVPSVILNENKTRIKKLSLMICDNCLENISVKCACCETLSQTTVRVNQEWHAIPNELGGEKIKMILGKRPYVIACPNCFEDVARSEGHLTTLPNAKV